MPSPIIARADALMQRRLHGQAVSEDVPTLIDAICTDGIPLLLDAETPPSPGDAIPATEVAGTAATPVPVASGETSPAPRLDADMLEIVSRELARRIEQRLVAELPRLIEATVRDFLGEQETSENTPPRA